MADKSNTIGGTIKLDGEAEYRKAIKNINSDLKEMGSVLKLATEQYKNNDSTLKNTKSTYKDVSSQLSSQKEEIKKLRESLNEAEKTYGQNSIQVKTWKTQLNNAETALYSLEKQSDLSSEEIKKLKNNEEAAGQGALTLGNLIKANIISDGIVGGIKSLGNAMKSLVTSLVDVGKAALEAYADNEQLIGGVETLFDKSSNTVKDYANNAYKTAGLSANQYMETVTSFSASLLQSLGGNTQKAAEIGNMAVVDMADNANKMGTDMSMIQSAYQGFAKQNYTMLDNLKLGYGGTKNEMKRLLSDAQKITGIKYDISNLNDVYQAIHVIQGELGITGTTAKEANETIQGSLDATKSAWQNMLVGIADDNADFDGLINNLVDSIATAAQNILPRVLVIIDGIVGLGSKLLEKIVEKMPKIIVVVEDLIYRIIDSVTTFLPDMLLLAGNIIGSLINAIISNLPNFVSAGLDIILSLINGISLSLPTLIPAIVDAILLIVDTLLSNINLVIEAGVNLIVGLALGLVDAIPKLLEKIPEIISNLVNALLKPDMLYQLTIAGIKLIVGLGKGLVAAIPELLTLVPNIIKNINQKFASAIKNTNWKELGRNVLHGILNGIIDFGQAVANTIQKLCSKITNGIKSFFGIASPSKMMRDQVGKYLAQGIGVGFENEMQFVNKDIQDALPTSFDLGVNANLNSAVSSKNHQSNVYAQDFDNNIEIIDAFKEALKNVKVVMNNEQFGKFVVDTVEEVVYG